jgi:hypothetical protein
LVEFFYEGRVGNIELFLLPQIGGIWREGKPKYNLIY